jgi:hypothetical protein
MMRKPFNTTSTLLYRYHLHIPNIHHGKSLGIVFLGLAIVLFHVLSDDEAGVGELPDIGNVVVLCQVHPKN